VLLLTATIFYVCTYGDYTTPQQIQNSADNNYVETYRQHQIYSLPDNEGFVGVNAVWHRVYFGVDLADLKADIDEAYR